MAHQYRHLHVLQLTWDDVFTTYGGIQSLAHAHMARPEADAGRTITRILPTMHAAQIRSPLGRHHLSLHNLEAHLEAVIRQNGVALVHSHNIHRAEGAGIAECVMESVKSAGLPHVVTVHDVSAADPRKELDRQRSLLAHCVLVATSAYVQYNLQTLMNLRSDIIPPCVPPDTVPEHHGKEGVPTIAAPGRILPSKGVIEAVLIAGHLSEQLGQLRIILSSTKHEHNGGSLHVIEELQRVARCFPKIKLQFFEGREAYPSLYRSAHLVLCLPHCIEGFGLIPLEALAAGVPSIVIPNGGMEWVKEFPASIHIEERHYPRIARLALTLLQGGGLATEQLHRDQERAKLVFSRRRMLDAYEVIYQRALQMGAPESGSGKEDLCCRGEWGEA